MSDEKKAALRGDGLSEDSREKETQNYGKNVGADKREEDSLEDHLDAIEHHLERIRGDMRHDEEHMDEGSVYRDDDGDDESVNEINGDAAGAEEGEGAPEEEASERTMASQRRGSQRIKSSKIDAEARELLLKVVKLLEEPGTQVRGTIKVKIEQLKKALEDAGEPMGESLAPEARKISTQEAKEITRRIVERIKKESN